MRARVSGGPVCWPIGKLQRRAVRSRSAARRFPRNSAVPRLHRHRARVLAGGRCILVAPSSVRSRRRRLVSLPPAGGRNENQKRTPLMIAQANAVGAKSCHSGSSRVRDPRVRCFFRPSARKPARCGGSRSKRKRTQKPLAPATSATGAAAARLPLAPFFSWRPPARGSLGCYRRVVLERNAIRPPSVLLGRLAPIPDSGGFCSRGRFCVQIATVRDVLAVRTLFPECGIPGRKFLSHLWIGAGPQCRRFLWLVTWTRLVRGWLASTGLIATWEMNCAAGE